MVTRKTGIAFIASWLLITAAAWQVAGQSLSASVSRNPVAVGEQFQVTFTLNASGSGFEGPSFSDFYVLSGPNQSSSVQIINGNISQSLSFTYYLQAKSEGQFKVGPASITSNGKKLESPSFTITVVKGQSQPSQQGQPGGQPQQTETEGLSAKDVFIRASVNKTQAYRGEAIAVTFRLYTRVQLVNYAISKTSALNGFFSVEVPMPAQLDMSRTEVINGVQYNYGEIKKLIAFPQQSGTLTIDAMEGECVARIRVQRKRNPNDPFDIFNDPFFQDPFFGRGVRDVKVELRSEPIKITVKDLPSGAPSSFKGLVGKFSFDARLDKNETDANEAVTLRLKLTGNGNIRLFNPPSIDVPPGIESYEPKLSDNTTVSISGVSGTRAYEYLLIPRNEGNFEIPPVVISYFDLEKKTYHTFASETFRLKVNRGKKTAGASVVTSSSKTEVQMLGQDIRFIKTGPALFIPAGQHFLSNPLRLTALLLPVLLMAVLGMVKKRMDIRNADALGVRSRQAEAFARKKLSLARKHMSKNEPELFYNEVSKALWEFVSGKFQIPHARLSKESVSEAMNRKGIQTEVIQQFNRVIDQCEMSRFGGGYNASSISEVYDAASAIISSLQQNLKS